MACEVQAGQYRVGGPITTGRKPCDDLAVIGREGDGPLVDNQHHRRDQRTRWLGRSVTLHGRPGNHGRFSE